MGEFRREHNWLLRADFSTGVDNEDLSSSAVYSATDGIGAVEIKGGGYRGTAATDNLTYFPDDTIGKVEFERRSTPAVGTAWHDNQYALCEIRNLASLAAPGVACRCSGTAPNVDGYMAYALSFASAVVAVGEFSSGVWTLLATHTGDADALGDILELDCDGTTISVYTNLTERISITDGTHTSGAPGVHSYGNTAAKTADNFEAGNRALLNRCQVRVPSPAPESPVPEDYPIVMSTDKFDAIYTSPEYDLVTDILRWWSVLVDWNEEETVLIGELEGEIGDGDSWWRTVGTREATERSPGGEFVERIPAVDTGPKIDDPAYRVCGKHGQHGNNVLVQPFVRFYTSAAWGPYNPIAWVGLQKARKIQVKLLLDRVALRYQIAIPRIQVAASIP